jgi:PEP-CTERM motif
LCCPYFDLDEGGFETLAFRVENGTETLLEKIFGDAASALAFFTGPAVARGDVGAVDGRFSLSFQLDLVSSQAGDRVVTLFALGTVPEPGTGALIALGLLAIAARRRRALALRFLRA